MYHTTMTRTQIYLPPNQVRQLKRIAVERNTSMSETIRQILGERLEEQPKKKVAQKKNAGESLLELADQINKKWKGKAPADLSENMDKYLYGNI